MRRFIRIGYWVCRAQSHAVRGRAREITLDAGAERSADAGQRRGSMFRTPAEWERNGRS
jgi:hypothetical protein